MKTGRYSGLLCCSAGFALLSSNAFGSGFALLEQSSSGLGRAYSGTAAVADDATTLFYNPAGMARLTSPEVSLSVAGINVSSHFRDAASQAALGQQLGADGGNAGSFTPVPSLYLTWPLSTNVSVGLGVNAPFGLKTEYDSDWIGRFQAVKSDVKTINVNPSLSWRLNEHFSIGAGVDYQHIRAELSSTVNYTAVLAQVNPALIPVGLGLQGPTRVKGTDSAWGFNVGLLYEIDDANRIGLSYRSSIKYGIEGDVVFSPPTPANPLAAGVIGAVSGTGGPLSNGPVSLALKLPDSAAASYVHSFGDKASLMVDVGWTGWSSVQELRILRTSGATLSLTPEQWKDTWRFAVGGDYQLNPAWTLRAGVARDQSPVPDSTRTPRLPDEDRTWITLGATWNAGNNLKVDVGYAHLFVKDASLNETAGNPLAYGLLNGSQDTKIDIISAQATLKF
jgi:long-chain fatty acid transport protein